MLSMLLNVDNVGAERMSSGRLFQAIGSSDHAATQNARLQRDVGQKGWEEWKQECTSRSDNMVQGRGLPCTPLHQYAEFERDAFPCPQPVQMIAE